jgi:hypothetical protein
VKDEHGREFVSDYDTWLQIGFVRRNGHHSLRRATGW